MNVDQFRGFCLAFPQATENIQWGDDLCFKVRGKIFATVALTEVPPKVCFKCSLETFAELTEKEGIHPAPYVGRYNWVILDGFSALSDAELRDFVRQSYEMVALKSRTAGPSSRESKRKRAKKSKMKATSLKSRRRS